MKEIVIVSGKGGTGKTSIVGAFASLARNAVFADCDVDAADLHLIFDPKIKNRSDFYSGFEASIIKHKCMFCGECQIVCRYGAVKKEDNTYLIDTLDCEGCGVCQHFCKFKAIELKERLCGTFFESETRFGPFVHAKLGIGAENSGKLVTKVRSEAKKIGQNTKSELLIIDGPPGIGCPAIASITGVDALVAVTEPTLSGQHDLGRLIELAYHFHIPVFVCVNKYDINLSMTEEIESIGRKLGTVILGRIPYDSEVTKAQNHGKTLLEWGNGIASKEVMKIWENLCSKI